MFKYFLTSFAAVAVVATVLPSGQTVLVPQQAVDHSPVISLGEAVDPVSGKVVEGYMFVHYKPEYAKPPGTPGKGGNGDSTCYAFLANGAKWKVTEGYVVDPTNGRGLDELVVQYLLAVSLETWDTEVAFDVFGAEVAGVADGADTVTPDGKNEVMFADVGSPGAIAVTVVWGVFRGAPSQRQLVEWDMVFDDVDFGWSLDGSTGLMDFRNIATHELGHAAGMGHPDDSCTEETMYRFADYGETKKRDLHTGDLQGILELYGA